MNDGGTAGGGASGGGGIARIVEDAAAGEGDPDAAVAVEIGGTCPGKRAFALFAVEGVLVAGHLLDHGAGSR